MRSTKMGEWLLSGTIVWRTYCLSERLLVLLLSTKCVQNGEMPCRLPWILSNKMISLVVRGRKISIQTRQAHKSSSLFGSSDLGCLQSWGHNLRFWILHPSLGQAAFQEWVVSMLVRKRHSKCIVDWIKGFFHFWCDVQLGILLSRDYRIDWVF